VLLTSLGHLWVRGAPVNWAAFDSGAIEVPVAVSSNGQNGVGQAAPGPRSEVVPAATNGSAATTSTVAPAAEPSGPEPDMLFDTNIDSGHVSRVLKELREGQLSIVDAMAKINATAPRGQSSPDNAP
jgi:glucose-6-phosphate isomerase